MISIGLFQVDSDLYSASFQKKDITEIETIGCSESVGFIITKICKVLLYVRCFDNVVSVSMSVSYPYQYPCFIECMHLQLYV